MEIRILGPLEVERDGTRVALGPRQQALLAILLVHRGAHVAAERIVEDLYAGEPPAKAAKTLQVHVSRLRKALGDGSSLQTSAGGYRFSPEPEAVDRERFEGLARRGRAVLAEGDATLASETFSEALALWRGPALSDFTYADFAQPEITRLEELRLATLEDRIDADLALHRQAQLVGELDGLVREHPLRERLRAQLMLALYRSGRQAEALEAYQDARRALVDELGIEPGRALRDLQQAILAQDPALDLGRAHADAEPAASTPMPVAAPQPDRRGERKTVTVVHVRVTVATPSGDRLDPEVLRNVTTRVFGEIARAIEAHEGVVDTIAGDSVTAIFGLPLVHEDDPVRAVRAAEEIHRRLGTGAGIESGHVDVRIGVSTGEVMTGDSSGPQGRATGEPLLASSALAHRGTPGEVVVDEATRRAVRATERGQRRFVSPMVGRERERRRLLDAFEQAATDGSCQLFTILGAAGVGKSRLVQEFLGDLAGRARVARGRCLPYGEGITFWPVLEAVMDAAGLDNAVPEQAQSRLAALIGDANDAELVARRVMEVIGLTEAPAGIEEGFHAVRAFFELLAADEPLVVIFDDIHWGEATFLDLVEHLADWSRGAPILLLCMARPELLDVRTGWGGGKLNATSVLLEPLSDDECAELVANLLGEAELAGEVETRITAAAEGNPLFVEEMLSMLIDDGLLVREGGRWSAVADLTAVRVPPTIQALLAARLDRLDDAERAVVERAAIEGKMFHRGSVEELADDDLRSAVPAHLGALVRKELIRPDKPFFSGEEAYRFRHLLIRDAAYDSIPKETRAGLHELHADWLGTKTTAGEYDEIVGYHLEQAFRYRAELRPVDDHGRALGRRAAERLGAAGRRAFLRSDAQAGANLISRAVEMLPADDALRVELVPNVRVVQGLTDLSWADRVLTDAIEAAATSGDRQLAAHALVQRGLLRLFSDSQVTPRDLLDVSERAIAVFGETRDELGLARAWRLAAQAHYLDRRAARSEAASEQALVHVRRAADSFEEQEIVEWLLIVLILGPAPAPTALSRCEQLLGEADEGSLLQAEILAVIAPLLAMQNRESEADEAFERARAIMAARGEWVWIAAFWQALVPLWRGTAPASEAELRLAYESLKAKGAKSHFSSIAHALASVALAQGQLAEAERLTRECEDACRANDVHSQVAWRSIRAQVFAHGRAFEEAKRLALEAVAIAAASDFLAAHAEALEGFAEVLELMGRREEAGEELAHAVELFEDKGNLLAAAGARARLAELQL